LNPELGNRILDPAKSDRGGIALADMPTTSSSLNSSRRLERPSRLFLTIPAHAHVDPQATAALTTKYPPVQTTRKQYSSLLENYPTAAGEDNST